MRHIALVSFFIFAACGVEGQGESVDRSSLQPLTCPAGQIAWNFSRNPTPFTSEFIRSNPDAGLPTTIDIPAPSVITIQHVYCAAQETLTRAAADACDGRPNCSWTNKDCNGAVQVRYSCSHDPSYTVGKICNYGKDCYFYMQCSTPAPGVLTAAERVACVPESCHAGTRRNENLECVTDLSRPQEFKSDGRNKLRVSQTVIYPMGAAPVYTPSRVIETQDGYSRIDMRFEGLGAPAQKLKDTLRPWQNLAEHHLLFGESLYDMEYRVQYVVPAGTANNGLQGNLVFWAYDEWADKKTTNGTISAQTFRCQMHTVDMRKYGKGTPIAADGRHEIIVKERFIIPKDCLDDSGTALESQTAAARKVNKTLLEFLNSSNNLRTVMAASYGLENNVMLFDNNDVATKQASCSPNPSDFFYDSVGQMVDRYRYLNQRRVPFEFIWSSNEGRITNDPYYAADVVYFRPTMQSHLGVSEIRPKKLVQKIRSVGPARGFLRADIDWYLTGDRYKYWQTFGLTAEGESNQAFLYGYLVPLDVNDKPIPAGVDGYPEIGRLRAIRSSAYGTTYSANYPVTEELRKKFMTPGSPLATTREGKKFVMRACLRFGGPNPLVSRSANNKVYTLGILQECQDAKTPLVIRLDPSVAPLDPLESDPFSEANPAGAGDSRMSQSFDNDVEADCVDGTHACRTQANNSLEGLGAFGGSVFQTDINSTTAADGGAEVHVQKDVAILGFTVEGDEEDQKFVPTSGYTEVGVSLTPPWDKIETRMRMVSPGLRWKQEKVVGQDGLAVGWSLKTPIRYGPLQGDVLTGFTVGFGASLAMKYSFGGTYPAGCTGSEGDCQTLYRMQPAMNLVLARQQCSQAGGRLADLSSSAEASFVRGAVPANTKVWVGGQLADEYTTPQCLQTWDTGRCASGHLTFMRWLSNDEDFAESKSFLPFTIDSTEIGYTPAIANISAAKPLARGVVMSTDNSLSSANMAESYQSVCKYRNAAQVTKHSLSGGLELSFGAGIAIAFCTPSEDFGVCLEGSVTIIGAKLLPNFVYTHHDIRDFGGRSARQSDLTFKLDWELVVLAGAIDVRVVIGKYFSFNYNLFSFSGFRLPVGGNLYEVKWPMYEEAQ